MPRFVIQKHVKRRTSHFDLMLEKHGKLLTWSITDILSLQKKGKAVQAKKLPDHRLLYLDYEGKISRGRGNVQIWDRGTYQAKQYHNAFIFINLKGNRLKGWYYLIADLEQKDNWWILNPVRKSDNNGTHNR